MPAALAKALGIWVLLALLAVLNGILREKVLVPLVGQRPALPLSGISLSLFIFLLTWIALPWIGPLESMSYGMIGAFWLLMTLLFEITFGRLVAGRSWAELLQASNFMTGNLWDLVLLSTAFSPYLAARLRGYA